MNDLPHPLPKTLAGAQTGTLPVEEVFAISGLEFLKGVLAGHYPPPPIMGTVPMDFIAAEVGKVSLLTRASPQFFNPIGTIHGGYAATVLDTALGCCVHSALEAGEAYTTMEIKIVYHRAILPDLGDLRCEGVVISRGRRAAASEAKLYDGKGRLLASGSSTCIIIPAPVRQDR